MDGLGYFAAIVCCRLHTEEQTSEWKHYIYASGYSLMALTDHALFMKRCGVLQSILIIQECYLLIL